MKRKIKVTTIEAITKSKNKDSTEFVLHIPSEYDYRYTGSEREMVIETIKKVYNTMTGKPLPIYGVPHLYLKDFVTSKADRKKNILRIPEEGFRIKDEGELVLKEAKKELPMEIETDLPNFHRTKSHSLYQKNKTEKNIMLDEFKVLKVIGKGSYGRVYLVEMISTNEIYAMKELRKDVLIDTDQIGNTKVEKEIMKNADHPFLINLDYVFQTPGRIYFVMKFMRGGELFSLMYKKRRFSESMSRFYIAQIVLALTHLHSKKILYRDLKPENILLDETGYICLADFGMSRFLEGEKKAMSFCGTPEYMAPEIILGQGYDKSVDWWSLGVLLYEMILGIPPFYNQNQMTMYQYITTKSVSFPDPAKFKLTVSEPAKDLILKVW